MQATALWPENWLCLIGFAAVYVLGGAARSKNAQILAELESFLCCLRCHQLMLLLLFNLAAQDGFLGRASQALVAAVPFWWSAIRQWAQIETEIRSFGKCSFSLLSNTIPSSQAHFSPSFSTYSLLAVKHLLLPHIKVSATPTAWQLLADPAQLLK